MNEDDHPRTAVEQLIAALEHQRGLDDGSRGELIASLRRIARGTAVPGDHAVAAMLDLLADSSLGSGAAGPAVDRPDPSEVGEVLDRLDAIDVPAMAGADVEDPVQAWSREFTRLLDAHRADLVGALPAYGTDEHRRDALAHPSLLARGGPDDERFARAVVENLGEDWTGSGLEDLFAAARRTHEPPGGWALRISGLAGADVLDPDAVRARLEGPIDALPVVRGRDRIVERLVEAARNRRSSLVQVLLGAPGHGKTTVALAAARRVRGQRMPALCLPAETLAELVDGLHLAAVHLGVALERIEVAARGSLSDRAARLWDLLDTSALPWLIVLDSAGEQAVGDPAWTRGSTTGTVVVTTRSGSRAEWGSRCRVTDVGPVPDAAGVQIVLDRIGSGPDLAARAARDHARVLATRLDGVPLALTSAGRLAAATPSGLDALERMATALDGLHAAGPVSAVYELGVRSGADPQLRGLVRLMACFAPNRPLPVDVLAPADDAGVAGDLLPRLIGTGLVEERIRRGGERTITIHPALADQSQQDRALDTSHDDVDRRAIALLRRRLRRLDPGVLRDRPTLAMLEPHVAELLARPAVTGGELLDELLDLAERTASALVQCGDLVAAGVLVAAAGEKAVVLDGAHPAVLALRDLRAHLAALGGSDFAAAERELVDVLALRTEVLGARHPQTLSTRDFLAWVSAERGVPEDAYDEVAAVLAARTGVLGADDPDTLATRHRLAWVTALLGRPDEAAEEFVEVLRRRRLRLGDDHIDVYSTRYRLAWALVKAGRLAEAEAVYRELQDDLEVAAGWRHPLTLMVRVRVGWVVLKQDRWDAAGEYLHDVLADQETVLGDGHPRALRTRHLLAYAALQRGAVWEAIRGFEDVVARRAALLGADHTDTLDSRAQLAWAWLHAGAPRTADRYFQAVVADRQRVLGPLNISTLRSRGLVARCRMMRGRLAEAQMLLRRLQEDASTVLPAGHRLLLDVRHTLAVVNGLRGRSATSEQELRSLADDRERLLGPDHRDTLASRDYLAWILGRQGLLVEAAAVAGQVLADRSRLLGGQHVHTLTSRYRIAWLASLDGRFDDAAEQFRDLGVDLHRVLGPEHPDTLRCRHGLVRVHRMRGDDAGIVREAFALLRAQITAHGRDAVDTLRAGEELGLVLRQLPGRERAAEAVLRDVLRRREAAFDQDHPDTLWLRAALRQR